MNKRRLGMLAALLVLFGLAAWLTMSGDPEAPAPTVSFPREMTPEAQRRSVARRTHAVQLPAGEAGESRTVQQDPLLASLPRGKGKSAVVLEANAIRNSPLGEMLLTCSQFANEAEELKQRSGIDVLQDLDRVALTPDGMTLSGNFAAADWDNVLPEDFHRAAYGDGGRIYSIPRREGSEREGPQSIAVWGDSFLVMGSEDEVRRTIDRLEGRGEEGPSVLDENQAYGEVYGVLGNDDLARFFGENEETRLLAELLAKAGSDMELHADTRGDVGVVAQMAGGSDPNVVRDLGQTMGGLLSAARIEAMANRNEEARRLLDMASIQSEDGAFNLELAVPESYLAELTQQCERRHEERREQRRRQAEEREAAGEHLEELLPGDAEAVRPAGPALQGE